MANLARQRSAPTHIGGKHLQDHKLVHDNPHGIRYSDQRTIGDDTTQGSTHHTGGRGSGQSTSEETTNEDDDEDSSANKEDEQEDEEDDPEVLAPSHGRGKGKGRRPASHIESADEDESQHAEDETASHETGSTTNNQPVNQFLNGNKKRTFSNVSNTSLLFGEDDIAPHTFPRPKVARTLGHSGGTGLLTYTTANSENANNFDDAVQSSDGEEDVAYGANKEKNTDDDDEDYSGVALISDSESDVEVMEQQEEHFIIQDEQLGDTELFSQEFNDARRLSLDSYGSESIFDLNGPLHGNFYTPASMQDVGFGQFFETEHRPATPEPISKRKFSDSSAKRVRFDDEVQVSDSSSSSSSELDSATFPDLFLEQDKLPPCLSQLLEADNDDDDGDLPSSASERSYWDVGQDESRNVASQNTEEFDTDDLDDSSDAGSSGYESDMGDTTDECDSDLELDPPPRTPRQKSVLYRPSSAPASKAASPKIFPRSIIGPRRGFFNHTDTREAIAVTNRNTKAVTFYRPRVSVSLPQSRYGTYSSSASTANNSPPTSLNHLLNASDSDISNDVFCNPFMNSTDIMLTGIFGSAPANASMFGGESIGPPEAFYPFISIGQNGNVISDEDDYGDCDEFDDDINIADFMDFGSDIDATDLDQEDETDVPATPATSMIAFNGSTPAQPTPSEETPLHHRRTASDAMLEHFDRAGVTAFRNNQNRYRDIACLPHDPNLRASVSRPIRSGRSAETLMSPLRKRNSVSKKSGSSPFAGVTKATGRLQASVMSGRRGPPMGTFS